MNEWWWTAAVAAVGIMAGYILCSLLVADRISRAQVTIRRVREVCANPETTWRPGEGLGLVRVESILRALEGDDR